MLIKNLIPWSLSFCSLFALSKSYYLSINHVVNHKYFGAFPEEDYITMAYVIGGDFMNRLLFMQHFKSILQNSDRYFRLHFITDQTNKDDLSTLMRTWNITNCDWFVHDLDKFVDRVRWIPNVHYSSHYGMSKLLIPEILPETVGKVMYVDVDLVFQADIFYLWQQFRHFNHTQSIGMIENMSDYYLNKDGMRSVWPAVVSLVLFQIIYFYT
ncbi:unnamed protein product [Caenorhabditis sp. 36 PRJEB53466]|nr:unnamed protein product [Caenorhabditis sp. 36 PRJEB53466]